MSPFCTPQLFADKKGELAMTAVFVFAALAVASVVYTVVDDLRLDTERQIDDFYRVEGKKAYLTQNGLI